MPPWAAGRWPGPPSVPARSGDRRLVVEPPGARLGGRGASGASSGGSPAGTAWSATTGRAPASPTAATRPATATRRWPCWPGSWTPSAPTGCTCSAPPPGCPVAATYAADHPDRVDRLVLYGGYARGADIAAPAARESMVGLVETHWGLGSRVLADVFLPGRERPRARGVRALPAAVGLAGRGRRSAAVRLRAGRDRSPRGGERADAGAAPARRRRHPVRARARPRRAHPPCPVRRAVGRRALPVARRHRLRLRRRRAVPRGPRPVGRGPSTGRVRRTRCSRTASSRSSGWSPRAGPTPRSPGPSCSAATRCTGTWPTSAPGSTYPRGPRPRPGPSRTACSDRSSCEWSLGRQSHDAAVSRAGPRARTGRARSPRHPARATAGTGPRSPR